MNAYRVAHVHSTKGAARRHLHNRFADMRRIERSYERMSDACAEDDACRDEVNRCFSRMYNAKRAFQSYMREQPKSQHGGTRKRPVKRSHRRTRHHRL